jgi:parallel beta-helix repeat protein
MANCSAIQNGYQGFYIYDSSHIKLNNCFARGNKYVGFFLTLLSLCTFENCQAVNQGQEGFKLQGCTSCTFKNIRVLDNSTASSGRYPGINLADWKGKGSLHNTFAGCISDNSRNIGQNYGLAVTGANSGRNVIMDGDYRHNVRGNLFLPHRHLELDNNSFP